MPSPKTIPKDDGGAPRFLKKIMADGKKKKRKQIIESDDEDGFTNNPSFGDSDDEGPSTRSSRRSTEIPKKKSKLRKDTELSVPKKDVPKKKLKDADEGSKKKGTSSLLANMEAPPPAASLLPDKKVPLKGTKMEGKEVLAGAMRILKEGIAKESSSSRAMKEERTKKSSAVDLSTSDQQQQQQQPPPLTPKRPPGRIVPKQPDPNKLEAFPTVSSPAQPPPSNPALVQNLVVANKPKKMTPKGRMMMSTLEKMCTKLNDHTHFQMLLRGNLPSTSGVDLSGSFSCDETTAFDFFTYNENGDILLPAKIAIFPEEFPAGGPKEHSLHWWGIVDPAVGARKPNNNKNNNRNNQNNNHAAPPANAPPPMAMDQKSNIGGNRGGGGGDRGDDYRRGEGRRRSPDRGGVGYHGDRHGGPPPPGWGGGGGGRWEEDYGRWEGGRHGGGPPPPHWGGGPPGPDSGYWEGRRGDGPDNRFWDGGRRGGEPYHNHRGGPPPPNSRGRGPPGPMDGRPMDRPPMDRPPMDRPPMDGDRPPMDRDRRGPPPQGFPPSGGRGGRRDRP